MYNMTKKLLLLLILSAPISVAFADAAIDAKIAAARAQMIRDFSPPKATQFLSVPKGSRRSTEPAAAEMPATAAPAPEAAPAQAPSGFGDSAPKSSGSWYVQPGDTGGTSGGASSGSGFDHSNLY